MRLWSIHPQYLDRQGLLALWRESLLAQKVLLKKTKGYLNHPQLDRFKKHPKTIEVIGFYLYHIYLEGKKRGYAFNPSKICRFKEHPAGIRVGRGQVDFELRHLKGKLSKRGSLAYKKLAAAGTIRVHPLFKVVKGGMEHWEKSVRERKDA